MVFGRVSATVPSNSITSSFAMWFLVCVALPFQEWSGNEAPHFAMPVAFVQKIG